MKNFSPTLELTEDASGNYSVDFTIFSPGKKYEVNGITQVQIDTYSEDQVPGIKVTVELTEVGPGNPFSFDGDFDVDPNLVLNQAKPYFELICVEAGSSVAIDGVIVREKN